MQWLIDKEVHCIDRVRQRKGNTHSERERPLKSKIATTMSTYVGVLMYQLIAQIQTPALLNMRLIFPDAFFFSGCCYCFYCCCCFCCCYCCSTHNQPEPLTFDCHQLLTLNKYDEWKRTIFVAVCRLLMNNDQINQCCWEHTRHMLHGIGYATHVKLIVEYFVQNFHII